MMKTMAIQLQNQTMFENGITIRSIDVYGYPTGEVNVDIINKFGYVKSVDLDCSASNDTRPIVILIVPF